MTHQEWYGAYLVWTALYFFIAGVVAEHSSSNKYKDLSSPVLPLVRGLLWPFLLLFYVVKLATV